MTIASPAIAAEMADWLKVGGSNSGIVGNNAHKYGFHRGQADVPASDYSRKRDPKGPNGAVNPQWACAGDFAYNTKDEFARLQKVLKGLLNGDPQYSMICEYIGRATWGGPVMYWSRWEGRLRRYTGQGHTTWSHISWYRSRADQRAYLFRAKPGTAAKPAKTPAKPAVKRPELRKGANGAAVKTLQTVLNRHGYKLTVDGDFGSKTYAAVVQFQRKHIHQVGEHADGIVGPKTWAALTA